MERKIPTKLSGKDANQIGIERPPSIPLYIRLKNCSSISLSATTNHRAPLDVIENTLQNQIKVESGTSWGVAGGWP